MAFCSDRLKITFLRFPVRSSSSGSSFLVGDIRRIRGATPRGAGRGAHREGFPTRAGMWVERMGQLCGEDRIGCLGTCWGERTFVPVSDVNTHTPYDADEPVATVVLRLEQVYLASEAVDLRDSSVWR